MDRFFISITPYAMSHELHGCYRAAMQELTHDVPPCFITKGIDICYSMECARI